MLAARKQVSSIDRLRTLPALFRGSDLTVRFEWDSKTASHYLWLWKQRHLIEALGGHSDVYANVLIVPKADWESALRMAIPSAVLIGIEVLRRAGWTTQIPSRPTVAVDNTQRVFKVERFDVVRRPPSWFATIEKGIIDHGVGLPSLTPAWALADMLKHEPWGECGLWPDDVDSDAMTPKDRTQLKSAARSLALGNAELNSFAQPKLRRPKLA
jgi:hypothetical protein